MWWIKPVTEVKPPKVDPFTRVLNWIHAVIPGDERKRIKYILLHNSTYNALLSDGRWWGSKTLYGHPVALVSDEFPEGLVIGDLTDG